MGEVVMSSEEVEELKIESGNMGMKNKKGGSSMVNWERFLPMRALRVLLVEADDSTKHISFHDNNLLDFS